MKTELVHFIHSEIFMHDCFVLVCDLGSGGMAVERVDITTLQQCVLIDTDDKEIKMFVRGQKVLSAMRKLKQGDKEKRRTVGQRMLWSRWNLKGRIPLR